MFDDIFTSYLVRTYPPEYVDMIQCCRETLANYGYSLVEANLYKTMPDISDIDISTSKATFEQCIRDGFKDIFSAIGVRSEIIKLSRLDLLLRTIKNLEETSLHEEVISIISSDEYSQADVLEHLFELVSTDPTIGDLMFEFELVDNNMLLDRLYDHHLNAYRSTAGEATEERPDPIYMERIRDFIARYPDSILGRKIASKNILYGETYEHYIAENRDELQILYPTFPNRVPIEFVALAIVANIQPHQIAGHVKTAISKFYGDLKFTSNTNYQVDKFLEEMTYERKPTSLV